MTDVERLMWGVTLLYIMGVLAFGGVIFLTVAIQYMAVGNTFFAAAFGLLSSMVFAGIGFILASIIYEE
jgi:hypothetical protein